MRRPGRRWRPAASTHCGARGGGSIDVDLRVHSSRGRRWPRNDSVREPGPQAPSGGKRRALYGLRTATLIPYIYLILFDFSTIRISREITLGGALIRCRI